MSSRNYSITLKLLPLLLLLGWMEAGCRQGKSYAADPPPNATACSSAYESLARAGKFIHLEKRPFEPGTGELDVRAALQLTADVPLERRSAFFKIPDLKYPEIRIDRIYRTDRSPSKRSDDAAGYNTPKGRSGYSELDAGGGEAVWENAMVASHLMVQVQPGLPAEAVHKGLPAGFRAYAKLTKNGVYLATIPTDREEAIERAILELSKHPDFFAYAEPDFISFATEQTPNDLNAGSQWHLGKISAPLGWDKITHPPDSNSANKTIVAVFDTGVDYSHPDLAGNIWQNPNPIAAPAGGGAAGTIFGDVHGWSFGAASPAPPQGTNDPMDEVGHGTHVAGILGASGNNATATTPGNNTCGVCWGVEILPLKILQYNKLTHAIYGFYSAAIDALDYMNSLNSGGQQVRVANHSWGGAGYSASLENTFNGTLFIAYPATSTYSSGKTTIEVDITTPASFPALVPPFSMAGMTITAGPGVVGARVLSATVSNGGAHATLALNKKTMAPSSSGPGSNPLRAANLTLSFPSMSSGVVHVAAAGNNNQDSDLVPVYPASFISPFILSVGASDSDDKRLAATSLSTASNYGATSVDLFAPGKEIWSTKAVTRPALPQVDAPSGTSMAAPQVSGALALLFMLHPELSDEQGRQLIIDSVDVIAPAARLAPNPLQCVSKGRLNLATVLNSTDRPDQHGVNGGVATGSSALGIKPLDSIAGKYPRR